MVLFQMWEPFRQDLIARHNFYVEQSRKRLLLQFADIEAEANRYEEEWLHKKSHHFDPDKHDPADLYEAAFEQSIYFYEMLEDMSNNISLSVVAGMFHEWDKQLRLWVQLEVSHWHNGEKVKEAIWKANFSNLLDLFEGLGWQIKSKDYYTSLDKCRLVVNAYKHGHGLAFDAIRDKYPEFISSGQNDDRYLKYADFTSLKVDINHIDKFSEAITSFWCDIPKNIMGGENLVFPKWFEKAYEKDSKDKAAVYDC